jgi:hypothetical protein
MAKQKHPVCPKCKKKLLWNWCQDRYVTEGVLAEEIEFKFEGGEAPNVTIQQCANCGQALCVLSEEGGVANHPSLANVDWEKYAADC